MSDLHGEYYKYISMLELIKFDTTKDELYILGDIIDRGLYSMEIYKHILENKECIHLLKGNHELMFQEYIEQNLDYNYSDWKYNGGRYTKRNMYRQKVSFKEFYNFIKSLPIVEVVDNKYILAHASTIVLPNYSNMLSIEDFISGQEEEYCLWDRDNIGGPTYKDYIHIYGHTMTKNICGENRIVKINNNIYIDCGACARDGYLACLRLDDMQEFYV
jgi:hypothetical protein